MKIVGIILFSIGALGILSVFIFTYLVRNYWKSDEQEKIQNKLNSGMNNNYIYFLEYTGYEMDDPYYGADFRPIFVSLDENKVIELFNKELEASKDKPDFEQEDTQSFSYTDGYKWCYRYRLQKLEMDKLIY